MCKCGHGEEFHDLDGEPGKPDAPHCTRCHAGLILTNGHADDKSCWHEFVGA